MDWAGLRETRKNLGVSYQELAGRTGYSYSHVKNAMGGNSVAGGKLYNALTKALGVDEPYNGPKRQGGARRPQPQKEAAPAQFTPGKKYTIQRVAASTGCAVADEGGLRLRYLRKEGKHHVFQSPSASWLTTFTDQQLVGMTWKKL